MYVYFLTPQYPLHVWLKRVLSLCKPCILYAFLCPATHAYEPQPLPPEWVAVVHSSGGVVYLHKPTRVCTWSRPYHVSSGAIKVNYTCEHSIYFRDQFWGTTHCLPTLYMLWPCIMPFSLQLLITFNMQ